MNPTLLQKNSADSNRLNRSSACDYRVAVGSTVLKVLKERDFPVRELVPFASPSSRGRKLDFGGVEIVCEALEPRLTHGFDLVISAAGSTVTKDWAERFADDGAFVIDKSSQWRMDSDKPLVVPEVNPQAIQGEQKLIASPNCSTIQMVVALAPIHRAVGIERIVVSTYQSVSGTGQQAIQELIDQSHEVLEQREDHSREAEVNPTVYPHQIAFNALPQVEKFRGESDEEPFGYTTEEQKMVDESRKILRDSADYEPPAVSATCVRVPVFGAHSESINIETQNPISPQECRDILQGSEGVRVLDRPNDAIYPLATQAEGLDDVLVGRIRTDSSRENALNLWVVGDNLRKGAATNAVQIAELLHRQGFIGSA